MSFKFTVGPHTTEVTCELVEDMAETVDNTDENVVVLGRNVEELAHELDMVHEKLDQLLNAVGDGGQPYVEFNVGPVRETVNPGTPGSRETVNPGTPGSREQKEG